MSFQDQHQRDERFRLIGRDLFLSGAVTSHGGNLSESDGEHIWISKRGSMLGQMGVGDVIEVGWDADESVDPVASRELVVHRAIYHALADAGLWEEGSARAIVHAHTVNTIFRSMIEDAICPHDSESKYVVGERVPVFTPQESIASPEAANMLAHSFAEGTTVGVLRTHGPFAVGTTLDEAFYRVSCLEASSKLLNLRDSTGSQFI